MAAMSVARSMAAAAAALVLASAPIPVRARLGGPANATSTAAPDAAAAAEVGAEEVPPGWAPAGFEEDLARAEAGLLRPSAFVRGSAQRGPDHWANVSLLAASAAVSAAEMEGHEYLATTTHYEDTPTSSCGSMDTAAVVAGTGYLAVASAESMQSHFAGGGCCWCGAAGAACGHGSGTAPMGCSACAKGRFLPKRPYPQAVGDHAIFHKEVDIVVVDICPHVGNEAWCPRSTGSSNTFGSKNHFDFASPPPGFDNYYFAFTPAPCSGEIQQRLARMSQCGR